MIIIDLIINLSLEKVKGTILFYNIFYISGLLCIRERLGRHARSKEITGLRDSHQFLRRHSCPSKFASDCFETLS